MQFAKSSTLGKRLNSKKYQIGYLEIFIMLLIKNGKKKYSKRKVFLLFSLLKKFFFSRLIKKKKWFQIKNKEKYFFVFLTRLLDSYRPKVSLVYKKSGSKFYMIPWYINLTKSRIMLIRWLIHSAMQRIEKTFIYCLFYELLDLFFFKGLTVKKLEEYYAIAVSNRPFLRLLRKKRKIARSRLKKFIA